MTPDEPGRAGDWIGRERCYHGGDGHAEGWGQCLQADCRCERLVLPSPPENTQCPTCGLGQHPGLTCADEGAVEDLMSDAAAIEYPMSRASALSRLGIRSEPSS